MVIVVTKKKNTQTIVLIQVESPFSVVQVSNAVTF